MYACMFTAIGVLRRILYQRASPGGVEGLAQEGQEREIRAAPRPVIWGRWFLIPRWSYGPREVYFELLLGCTALQPYNVYIIHISHSHVAKHCLKWLVCSCIKPPLLGLALAVPGATP